MKNIKQQIQEFRSSTPKHVKWLLLVAAFVIVVILLVLIFGSKSKKSNFDYTNQGVSFEIQPKQIDFQDVVVGQADNQNVSINVNMPVILDSISIDVDDISTPNNCDNLVDSCLINVIYKPRAEQAVATANIVITWHTTFDENVNTENIPVVYSAQEAMIPVEEEPEPEPDFLDTNEDYEIAEHVIDEIETITPDEVFDDPEPVFEIPEVVPEPEVETKISRDTETAEFLLPNENCSDYAIPGYDKYGIQIGWIKPERGANYFYPLADRNCTNPTGKYDFSTGIITSLTDGSKIGTDANHIGYMDFRSSGLSLPKLSDPVGSSSQATKGTFPNGIWTTTTSNAGQAQSGTVGGIKRFSDPNTFGDDVDKQRYASWTKAGKDEKTLIGSADKDKGESVVSSLPYDRTFILRQFKPIPATIVSEVRADPSVYGCTKSSGECEENKNYSIPVRATVDRNVFSDDGRTIIIPTGTLLMGYLDGELPGPYQAVGRMNIRWYQFIRPDGVEFNFKGDTQDPYSADAQGRMGVPGHGSTDYMEQMVMPILTSLVPAAVNMIAPIADTVINQIDLDNNTIVQSGTVRSSEMAKQEVINTWNKVAQKLLVDVMSNTTPPFSIAAGTRINVFSPVDLIVSCEGTDKKCSVIKTDPDSHRASWADLKNRVKRSADDASWVGQVRSFDLGKYCEMKNNKLTIASDWYKSGYDYRTVYAYCESQNYQAKNNAKQAAYNQSVVDNATQKYGSVNYNDTNYTFEKTQTPEQTKAYNQEVLGLQYDDDNNILNPFSKPGTPGGDVVAETEVLACDDDGTPPDANGCCPGETYTDMGEAGFNCCPDSGGDCFPPIEVQ